MIDAFMGGLSIYFSWPTIGYVIAGCIMGLMFGLIPGLGGSLAMAMLLPVTFGMDMNVAIPLLVSTWGASEGSATAILFNIPGEAENAATLIDGHPLAQQGRAGEACAASGFSSLMGVLLALLIFVSVLPIARGIVMYFGPPEFFVLAMLGLLTIAAISKGNLIKGLVVMCVGIVLAFHGTNPITGGIRYTFGSVYLWEGVPMLTALIGLFGLAECVKLLAEKTAIVKSNILVKGGYLTGIVAVIKNWKTWLMGAVMGSVLGAIPGVGGSVPSWLAYSGAVTITGRGEKFGEGNIKGVIAPEAANNAKDVGHLMPLIMLGIPGSVTSAMLATALILHGIYPGRELITKHLDTCFLILQCLAFSNIFSQSFTMFCSKYYARMTIVSPLLLVPVITTTCLVGAFNVRKNMIDVALTVLFCLLGYFMDRYNVPKIGIVMGIVLTPLAERSFQTALQMSDGDYSIFLTRPASATIIAVATAIVLYQVVDSMNKRRKVTERLGKTP